MTITITASISTPSSACELSLDGGVLIKGHGTIKYPIQAGEHLVTWIIEGNPGDVYMVSISGPKSSWIIQGVIEVAGALQGQQQININ